MTDVIYITLSIFIQFESKNKNQIYYKGGKIIDKNCSDERFSLISPQDQSHDLGNSAYKIKEIFSIFKNRYNFLTHYNFSLNESVLKFLVNPSGQVFKFKRDNGSTE